MSQGASTLLLRALALSLWLVDVLDPQPSSYYTSPTEWRQASGTGGVVLINLVHCIDLLRSWFGPVERVFCERGASMRGFEVEETGACTLRFASGVVGSFVFSECVRLSLSFFPSALHERADALQSL